MAMTPQELAEFRELAGLNGPSAAEQNRIWADKQIAKIQPPPIATTPLENLALRLNGTLRQSGTPQKSGEKKSDPLEPNLDGLADRLNGLMKTPGVPPKPTVQKQPDPSLDNVANRLNSLLGSGNFKIERLN